MPDNIIFYVQSSDPAILAQALDLLLSRLDLPALPLPDDEPNEGHVLQFPDRNRSVAR